MGGQGGGVLAFGGPLLLQAYLGVARLAIHGADLVKEAQQRHVHLNEKRNLSDPKKRCERAATKPESFDKT